jgi:hypothetical protein
MTNFQRFELYLKIFTTNRIEIQMRHCAFGLASSWPNCLGRPVLALRPAAEAGEMAKARPWRLPAALAKLR